MGPMKWLWPAVMVVALGACASAPRVDQASGAAGAAAAAGTTASLHGDAARPAEAAGWARSELYFAIAADGADAAAIAEGDARWRAFLDREVTPRFPDGLSVLDADGQWLARGASEPSRLKSKVLVILHPDTPAVRADFDAIRLAWKRETGHVSVLWSRQRVDVSF